jgi:predicted ribosome quality control (RQC) complex YloA/Tae2 family protein
VTFDALAMHAVRDEVAAAIEGGHVDTAILLDPKRVALEVFNHGARCWLVLALSSSDSRIFLTHERVRRATELITPFGLLLRKYVKGARVLAVEQPRLERILTLRLSSRPDDGLPRSIALVAEAMGRRSNLALVDEDGAIMDMLERVPPSVNPSRPLLPHQRYTLPPAETKIDPADPGLAGEHARAAYVASGPAAALLIRVVAGVSPLAAREALARAELRTNAAVRDVDSWDPIAAALRGLAAPIETGDWQPSIAFRDDQPVAFAPYRIQQHPDADIRDYDSMSEVVAVAGGPSDVARSVPFARLRRPLLDALAARAEQDRRKRGSLERSLAAADCADELREAGEAILASAHAIPEGAASLEWEGRRIDLYPTLSPVENAQSYFRQYTDARDAKRVVPPLLAEVEAELEYLDEMAMHVQTAGSEAELADVRRELEGASILRPAKPPKQPKVKKGQSTKPPPGPHRRLTVAGAELLVGTSALGNESVTFRLAQPDDLWFHARRVPGSHVILRTHGHPPPAEQIEAAAAIAAGRSAARTAARVEVDYTSRRYVKKVPGGPPGRVTYREETTIAVAPAPDVSIAS